jgi:23S rRNA (pseudouridine1915-N3)-methyltransferase
MKLQLWSIGKNHEPYVQEGVELFTRRIRHYFPVEWKLIPPPKNAAALPETDLKKKEGEQILGLLEKDDFLLLLDEKGRLMSSPETATLLRNKADAGTRNMVFLIGGAFGVSEDVKKRAGLTWSFSPLVFPHQLMRLMLAEQLYRACTILNKEKYHHS